MREKKKNTLCLHMSANEKSHSLSPTLAVLDFSFLSLGLFEIKNMNPSSFVLFVGKEYNSKASWGCGGEGEEE